MIKQKLREVGIGAVSLLLFVIFISSCSKGKIAAKYIKDDVFISSTGRYYFNGLTLKLSEIDGQCLVYSLKETKSNRIIIGGDIFSCFSKNQKWCLYIDENYNIWFYNTDYQNNYVWIAKENYRKHDFVLDKIKPPIKFKQKISN